MSATSSCCFEDFAALCILGNVVRAVHFDREFSEFLGPPFSIHQKIRKELICSPCLAWVVVIHHGNCCTNGREHHRHCSNCHMSPLSRSTTLLATVIIPWITNIHHNLLQKSQQCHITRHKQFLVQFFVTSIGPNTSQLVNSKNYLNIEINKIFILRENWQHHTQQSLQHHHKSNVTTQKMMTTH